MGIISKRKSKKKRKGRSQISFGSLIVRPETSEVPREGPPTSEGETAEEEVEPGEEAEPEAEPEEKAESVQKSKKPAVVSKGETFNMCHICMGLIKHGLAMFACSCRKVYHVSCGKRLGECPNCSSHLSEDMIVGKEKEVEEVKVDYESFPVPKLRLTTDDKLELLEERLILGEVSEDVYRELKSKYEKELEVGAEAEALYQCPSCNSIVDRGAQQCSCGLVFSDKEGFLCPECAHVVPFDSDACRYCGVRFSKVEEFSCPSCGKSLGWGVKQCSCGTRFSDELVEGFQCPSCGKFLDSNSSSCDACGVIFSDPQ